MADTATLRNDMIRDWLNGRGFAVPAYLIAGVAGCIGGVFGYLLPSAIESLGSADAEAIFLLPIATLGVAAMTSGGMAKMFLLASPVMIPVTIGLLALTRRAENQTRKMACLCGMPVAFVFMFGMFGVAGNNFSNLSPIDALSMALSVICGGAAGGICYWGYLRFLGILAIKDTGA